MTQNHDGIILAVDEHAARRTQIIIHIQSLDAMLARNNVRKERIDVMLAGHDIFSSDQNGKTIADEYAAGGYRFEPAAINRINGAAELTSRLGEHPILPPTIKIARACQRLIECIPDLQHDPDRPEDVLKVDTDPDTGEGGDDPYDACRYGIMRKPINRWNETALQALSSRSKV
jgi:hypothetical protein